VGTGAFTSVEADRSVDVEVAGDSSAYLQLEKTSSSNSQQYVNVNSGKVSFDFSSGNTDVAGNGFNPNAVTEVENLLRVGNQGTQTVEFYVDLSGVNLSNGTTIQVRAVDGTGSGASTLKPNIADNGGASPTPESMTIGTGVTAILDLIVDTTGFSTGGGTLPFEDDDGTVTFVADQSGP
jgi:hypothetical protein